MNFSKPYLNTKNPAPYMYVFPMFLGIHRVGHLVESLRLVKSPAEISLLKKCSSITAQGFIKVPRNVCICTQICLDDMEIEQLEFQNNGTF
jgi:Xaa-Pro aminopeptidase